MSTVFGIGVIAGLFVISALLADISESLRILSDRPEDDEE